MSRELFLVVKVIKFEEGLRLKPYYDHLGFPTIGYGELIGKKGDPLPDITWTEQQANEALDKKLKQAYKELPASKVTKAAWASLEGDTDRLAIFISLWYQLGLSRLEGFKSALEAIATKDWNKASEEMLNSLAARQTPKRWKRQSKAMLTGDVLGTYNL